MIFFSENVVEGTIAIVFWFWSKFELGSVRYWSRGFFLMVMSESLRELFGVGDRIWVVLCFALLGLGRKDLNCLLFCCEFYSDRLPLLFLGSMVVQVLFYLCRGF